jgi:hypothetical protein
LEDERLEESIYNLLCQHNVLCDNAVAETPFDELPENIRMSLRHVVNLATALTRKARPAIFVSYHESQKGTIKFVRDDAA